MNDKLVDHDYLPKYGPQDQVLVVGVKDGKVKYIPYANGKRYFLPLDSFLRSFVHDDNNCAECRGIMK